MSDGLILVIIIMVFGLGFISAKTADDCVCQKAEQVLIKDEI